jgi:hypothetical protein
MPQALPPAPAKNKEPLSQQQGLDYSLTRSANESITTFIFSPTRLRCCGNVFSVASMPTLSAETAAECSARTGGTGTVIQAADHFRVPVFNLARVGSKGELREFLRALSSAVSPTVVRSARRASSSGCAVEPGHPWEASNLRSRISSSTA